MIPQFIMIKNEKRFEKVQKQFASGRSLQNCFSAFLQYHQRQGSLGTQNCAFDDGMGN
jgi:hypothetical protein